MDNTPTPTLLAVLAHPDDESFISSAPRAARLVQ